MLTIFGLANFSQARTWTQSGTDGLGDTANWNFYGFQTIGNSLFTGSLYVGPANGAQAFTTSDGSTWVSVDATGFGDGNNYSYGGGNTTFNNNVYFCLRNITTGAEVWSTSNTGVLSASQVNVDGFGAGNQNADCYFLKEYKGILYGGTENTTAGGQVYAYSNGTTWTQTNTNGFGSINNDIFYSGEVFKNYLYVGTRNATTGGQIWRTDGSTWSQVTGDAFGVGNASYGIMTLQTFGNYLYAGIANNGGAQIWRTSDGVNWTNTGFSSTFSLSIQGMYATDNLLFAGTSNLGSGAGVFETSDGTNWIQNNVGGFGTSGIMGNIIVRGMGLFGDYLYAGAFKANGGTIWKTDIIPPIVTASPDNKASRKKIKVTLSSNDSSGSIYYTTDGSIPTTGSNLYTGQITFKKTKILKFIGVDTEGNVSSVQTKHYVVTSYPYLYNTNKELREKNGTIKFYNISTSKYGKKFKPFSSGLKYFTVADPNQDNKTEIIANNGNEIKFYNSKRKLRYTLKSANDYLTFGDINNSKKEKTLIAKAKTLKIYNKTSLEKTFNFSENIKSIAVGRVLKYDQPLIIVGFDDQIKLYKYKNKSLVLKKTKSLNYSKLLAYDLDTNGTDNIIYSKNKKVYVLNKKLKKKFSFSAGGSFLAVADVNDDYLLEILASTGKKLKTYSNEGILLNSKKDSGKWIGARF